MRTPYGTDVGVRALLPFVASFTGTHGIPGASAVAVQLANAANELDAALADVGYSVPVGTGASLAQELLRTWNEAGAAAAVAFSLPQGTDSKHAAVYEQKFAAILAGIRAGDLELPDADRGAGSLGRFAGTDPEDSAFSREGVSDI